MQIQMQYSPSLTYFTGKYIIEMKDRVTVLKIQLVNIYMFQVVSEFLMQRIPWEFPGKKKLIVL